MSCFSASKITAVLEMGAGTLISAKDELCRHTRKVTVVVTSGSLAWRNERQRQTGSSDMCH